MPGLLCGPDSGHHIFYPVSDSGGRIAGYSRTWRGNLRDNGHAIGDGTVDYGGDESAGFVHGLMSWSWLNGLLMEGFGDAVLRGCNTAAGSLSLSLKSLS